MFVCMYVCMYVQASQGGGRKLADDNDNGGFDAIYSSQAEEYRLLNPTYILPEFVILYRYVCMYVCAYKRCSDNQPTCIHRVDRSTYLPTYLGLTKARAAAVGGGGAR